MPKNVADLDRLADSGDWTKVVARLRSVSALPDVALDLNWEKRRVLSGGGFITVYAYMYDLWRMGSALPATTGDGLKQTAGAMFVYAYDLIVLDGTKCSDVSAPGHRSDQLFLQNADVLKYMTAQPRATRLTMASVSLGFERATSELRRNDDVLCSGGLDQMSAGLAANGGKPMTEVPSAPGIIGRTVVVPTAPGYHPQFVAEDVWRPAQDAIRATMPERLTKLVTVPADGTAPAH